VRHPGLATARADDWPQITILALEGAGQPYAQSIENALREGQTNEETAEKVRREIE
jgi:hypothetical protein